MKVLKISQWLVLMLLVASVGCNSKKSGTNDDNASRVLHVSNVNVPEWSNAATIYEVNLRQYTEEGTIEAFRSHLPRLKEMGVKILWFMPIYPISEKNRKGSLGSYYAVKNYKDVNPEFGSIEEFKALVTTCHDMGFKVILDWVANHTGWDNQWIIDHPDWYRQDSVGNVMMAADWADVAQLNYENKALHAAMIDALSFWVSETDVDGFRCDVAGMVPVEFWDAARTSLDAIKPVYMLAEDESVFALMDDAFNSNYGWSFHHIMNEIAKGEAGPQEVKAYFARVDSMYPKGTYPMLFTSNHDENSWNGSAPKRLGNALKAMAVLSFTVPGMPLIYGGQEATLNKELAFFEKDEIDWSDTSMYTFYNQLVNIKRENKALWSGVAASKFNILQLEQENAFLAFSRFKDDNTIVVMMNLSADSVSNSITAPTIGGEYTDLFSGKIISLEKGMQVSLIPWTFKVLRLNI